MLVYVHITNNSMQTISINDIGILIDKAEFHCSSVPVKVMEITTRTGKEIISHEDYFSMKFPITLAPLCGDSGYLNFECEIEIPKPYPSNLTFVIRTNRGRAMKKTLSLNMVLD